MTRAPATGSGVYEVRVAGHLEGSHWAAWFDGLRITLEPCGESLIAGPMPDQAALHGVLARIRDLNLVLLSVSRVEPITGSDDGPANGGRQPRV